MPLKVLASTVNFANRRAVGKNQKSQIGTWSYLYKCIILFHETMNGYVKVGQSLLFTTIS